jgi:FAD binding domain/Berberine and berberine like
VSAEVLAPGSEGYEDARKPAIARFHGVRPQAVVRCAATEDVVDAIAFARRAGLPVAIRSGGHDFAGRSTTTGVVIDVGSLDAVSVSGGVATVGAGARLGAVYDALLEHGATIAAGCGPAVGIAGLTLGGGLGILGRRHGLTCDQLLGAEIVLADGRVVACDEQREADLFWALRGAGAGHFGVVTSFTFRTVPPPEATAFDLRFPHTATAGLVEAWQGWAPDAPEELAASLLITAGPDPAEPPVVKVFGAMLGSQAVTEALLSRLDPATAELRQGTYREIKRHLAGAGEPDEGHPYSRSHFVRDALPPETIAALVEHLGTGRRPGETRELDFTPWAGAYCRVPADATAFAHRDARFLLKLGVVLEPGMVPGGWLNRAWELVRPWGTGGAYPNFPDPELSDPATAYWGANAERVRRLERRYDPDGFFARR